jgi:hypothetical protein
MVGADLDAPRSETVPSAFEQLPMTAVLPGAAGSSGDQPRPDSEGHAALRQSSQKRGRDRQGEYCYVTLLSGPGCTEVARGVHGSCDQPGGWGTVPRLRGGASSWAASDSPVQVELFQEALMPGVLRDRGQAGRLVLEGDPVHGRRPVRGAVRAEQGVGGCRVVAGFRFPRG